MEGNKEAVMMGEPGCDVELTNQKKAAEYWLSDFNDDLKTEEGTVALGNSLMANNFFHSVITFMNGSYMQISHIVEASKRSPSLFTADGKSLETTNTIMLNTISKELVKHKLVDVLGCAGKAQ